VGDITLNCTGGVPTPAGQVVQPINVTVTLNTYLTSRILSGNFIEALLIIDEPHSQVNPTRSILNCGNTGATDNGPSGKDVCAIVATADPSHTYDGTPGAYGGSCSGGATGVTCASQGQTFISGSSASCSANTYSCGRPNIFQGQLGTPDVAGQTNAVTWLGIPLDPPGTTTSRTIRITNLRADAHDANASAAPGVFYAGYIQATISINSNTSLALNNPQQYVAFVGPGLTSGITQTNFNYLQCSAPGSPNPAFTWTEGFASSFKAKNIAMILNSGTAGYTGNGTLTVAASYWSFDGQSGSGGTTNYPKDFNQNVPGALYNTESGFMYPGIPTLDSAPIDPTPNPPLGIGTVGVTANSAALHNSTGIDNAGIANTGTRLQVQVSLNGIQGLTVLVPEAIYLTNGVGTASGIAMLVTTASDGSGSYAPVYQGSTASVAVSTFTPIQSSGLAVYEVIFADPFSVESATMQAEVAYTPNLNLNQPTPNTPAQAFGGFAPFSSAASAHLPSSTLSIPRFVTGQIPASPNFFEVSRCACNLLFPFVSNQGGYDTGIAIANTSLDNLGVNLLASAANQQFGGVEFWYYGSTATANQGPGTQCTTGTCPPNAPTATSAGVVPAGQILTYVLSTGAGSIGNNPNGLDNRAAGFQGYIIAQAQFQYCHAYAFITAAGAGPLSAAVSEGYLGLLLDNMGFVNCSTGICRTTQRGESLVH
jgi:hypothetical protein